MAFIPSRSNTLCWQNCVNKEINKPSLSNNLLGGGDNTASKEKVSKSVVSYTAILCLIVHLKMINQSLFAHPTRQLQTVLALELDFLCRSSSLQWIHNLACQSFRTLRLHWRSTGGIWCFYDGFFVFLMFQNWSSFTSIIFGKLLSLLFSVKLQQWSKTKLTCEVWSNSAQ